MLATKKITTINDFQSEVTLFESSTIHILVNIVVISIYNSKERALIDLNQTIEKDVFCMAGNRGFHLVVSFMKSAKPIRHKNEIGIDIDIGVNDNHPVYLFKSELDLELEKYIRTVNKQKHLLQ